MKRREIGDNIWLSRGWSMDAFTHRELNTTILANEAAVGLALFKELRDYAAEKQGDIVVILLGGRGAQAMYKHIAKLAGTDEIDDLLSRLHVFTQDALAPISASNSLSFVRDFERLLGPAFFAKIKSFTPMNTETDDIEGELIKYLDRLESLGGIDLFFLGLGPEANAASHLCYIKPGSGAALEDIAGITAVSPSILEHHISKFKSGGSAVSESDETECRNAKYILTLGPAAILGARRIVQSIIDAAEVPAKKASFKLLNDTKLADNTVAVRVQVDENPGLLVRLHRDVRTYITPELIAD
jgi:6-phosphogluconolactonase/glucosamine-6-phosphate isomerase/deaminase